MSSKVIRGELHGRAQPFAWQPAAASTSLPSGTEAGGPSEGGGDTEQLLQREREAAYQRGLADGQSAAQEQFTAELRRLEKRMAHSIDSFGTVEERMLRNCRKDLVTLSLAIARRVLHRELTIDPGAIEGIVTAALERLGSRSARRVRVHPSQADRLRAILSAAHAGEGVEVTESAGLEPGDMVFETDNGHLDASIETQLDEIQTGLADELG